FWPASRVMEILNSSVSILTLFSPDLAIKSISSCNSLAFIGVFCSLFNSFGIAVGARVDFYFFVLLNEKRYVNGSAGFHNRFFGCVGGGVAFNAGLRVGNGQLHKRRNFTGKGLFGFGV